LSIEHLLLGGGAVDLRVAGTSATLATAGRNLEAVNDGGVGR
jgi:hypothetical protein